MRDHNLNPTYFDMDEIVSIELIGEADTIDITVDDTHMFYANDVYSHNSAIDSDIIQADKIADSYAKVMNADFIISISRKDTDKLNNTARFHVMKNRFGQDGMTFPSKMDTNKGIIEVYASNSSNGVIASKASKNGEVIQRQLLAKKYVDMDMG